MLHDLKIDFFAKVGRDMKKHVIKLEYENGKKLDKPILWCGIRSVPNTWYFLDAQHLALSVGGSLQPCKNCVMAIIKTLQKEL